jgi:hypothetical protein
MCGQKRARRAAAREHRRSPSRRSANWPRKLQGVGLLVADESVPTSWGELLAQLSRDVDRLNDAPVQSRHHITKMIEALVLAARRESFEDDPTDGLRREPDLLPMMRRIAVRDLATLRRNLTAGFAEDEDRIEEFRSVINLPPSPPGFVENVATIIAAGVARLMRCRSCDRLLLTTDQRQIYCNTPRCAKAELRARLVLEEEKLMAALNMGDR